MAYRKRRKKEELGEDLGFVEPVSPCTAPGASPDPFDQLAEAARDQAETDEAEEESFGSLEEEFQVLSELRRERDRAERRKTDAEKLYQAQAYRMLRAMEAQGTRQFKSGASGGSCYVQDRYVTQVVDDKAFMDWVQAQAPELLTVNAQRRTKFVREEFRDKGVPVDDGSFPDGIETREESALRVSVPKDIEGG
jgi:hypothetical protein